nr:winged helix-turn-helix domain-containing protein [Mycolicibacterium gilvum]
MIDVAARRVFLRGGVLALTRTEFAILCVLAESPGEPVTCRQLQLTLWGDTSAGGRSTLGVHVGNLNHPGFDAHLLSREGRLHHAKEVRRRVQGPSGPVGHRPCRGVRHPHGLHHRGRQAVGGVV